MDLPQSYILIAIISLAIIAMIVVSRSKKPRKKISPPTILAFIFIVMSFAFSEDKLISYSLLGVGTILAVIEILKGVKNN